MMFPPLWATNMNIIHMWQPDPIVFHLYFRALGNLCRGLTENIKFWGHSKIEALMWMRFGENKVQQPQRNENAVTPYVRTKILICGIIQEQG